MNREVYWGTILPIPFVVTIFEVQSIAVLVGLLFFDWFSSIGNQCALRLLLIDFDIIIFFCGIVFQIIWEVVRIVFVLADLVIWFWVIVWFNNQSEACFWRLFVFIVFRLRRFLRSFDWFFVSNSIRLVWMVGTSWTAVFTIPVPYWGGWGHLKLCQALDTPLGLLTMGLLWHFGWYPLLQLKHIITNSWNRNHLNHNFDLLFMCGLTFGSVRWQTEHFLQIWHCHWVLCATSSLRLTQLGCAVGRRPVENRDQIETRVQYL